MKPRRAYGVVGQAGLRSKEENRPREKKKGKGKGRKPRKASAKRESKGIKIIEACIHRPSSSGERGVIAFARIQ
jgi:hypothetical protein